MVVLDFYKDENVVAIAKQLIGKTLCTKINGQLCKGMITETEAYRGYDDAACHANNGKRTARTEPFYREGGIAYVYLCYGIHCLFNIITNKKNKADAVLIRSIAPLEGVEHMLGRRAKQKLSTNISAGPGNLSKAMGIDMLHNGISLTGPEIWLETGLEIGEEDIGISARIGIDYAKEAAKYPWRFYYKKTRFISK